jgi:membrane fusion protein, multidrug efflux system
MRATRQDVGTSLRGVGTAFAAVAWFGLAGCEKKALPAPPPPTVQVATVTLADVPLSTEIIGQLDSPQSVEVRARVESFVDQIHFKDGTQVKEGDPLFGLDRKPAEQRLAAAEGKLAEANANLSKARTDVERLRPLAEKRAIPRQDLDNAEAAAAVAQAAIQSAEASLQSAKIDLGYCELSAPVSGLIGASQVALGELVGKGEPTLLATISVLDPIWFYCNVSEVQFLKAEAETERTGRELSSLPLTLILANGTEHPEPGKFTFIDRAVDPKTGTIRVRAGFPNTKLMLRPGMFGRIKVDLGTRKDNIVVPARAVTELQGRHFAWVVGEDSTTTQRSIKVGETIDGKLLVLEGLKAGERVVTEGVHKVREGGPVQVVPATGDAAKQD